MANIIGQITINQSKFVELDASPLSSVTSGLEIGDFCIVDGASGVWQKSGAGSFDFVRVDFLSTQSSQATAAGNLALTSSSAYVQIFTGTATGQTVSMPQGTSLPVTARYEIWNKSSQSIVINDFGSNGILTLAAMEMAILVLTDNSTSNGSWKNVVVFPTGGGGGGVTYGSPVALSPDSGNVDGIATTVARSDHKHDLPAAAPTTTLAPSTTNAEGTGTSVARNDHTHAVSTALVGSITTIQPDDAASAGTADNFARGDHKHAIVADAPSVNLSATTTNAEGVSTSFSRADHSHAISTGVVSSQTPDQTNATGTSANLARADHTHNISTGVPSTIGTANAQGTAAAFARQDHVHNHGSQTTGTHHAVVTTSVNGFMSATDKTKLDALVTKSGKVTAGTFAGNPKKATVTFTAAFASTSYSIVITGTDGRTFTYESQLAGSFVINANANTALTGDVHWQAQLTGEVG